MKCIYCENDEDETEEEITDSDENEKDFDEEYEASFWPEQRISDLEKKLSEANQRIALLEQLLGVNRKDGTTENKQLRRWQLMLRKKYKYNTIKTM